MGCTNHPLAFLLLRMQLPSTHRSNVDYGLWPMDWTIAYGLDCGLPCFSGCLQLAEAVT